MDLVWAAYQHFQYTHTHILDTQVRANTDPIVIIIFLFNLCDTDKI